MKKSVKILLVVSVVLISAVLFFILAKPFVRVIKEEDEKGNVKLNVKVTALSFRSYYATDVIAVEKLENGEWEECPVIKVVHSRLALMPLNYPGKTYTVFGDIGFVYDISAPGQYRVKMELSRDDRWTDTFTVTREFRVK